MKFILGKKIKMTQVFDGEESVPITLIEAGPCFVTQIKDEKKDGYISVQIGFEEIIKKNKIKKSSRTKPYKWLREFRGEKPELKIGDSIDASVFEKGDLVDISGISKGKGFQGAVKRWNFSGLGASHGVKHHQRTIGSVGCRFPQRVIKGRKMPGRMGYDRVTVKNLEVVGVESINNILLIKGAVPGREGTLLEIRSK